MDLEVSHKKFAERLERQANDGHGWDKAPDMLREAAVRIRLLRQELQAIVDGWKAAEIAIPEPGVYVLRAHLRDGTIGFTFGKSP